ncbi:hypothetical protein CTI12_AA460260 [Artemisia annua]|uniref:Uncharacterized protein n=1 Tax=Artemisia annua TaxID=35608 RepID=A0A2U1LRX9_ARTAN|nr:hypothetical protein CTI12_AA460260 [Artemisia annua]
MTGKRPRDCVSDSEIHYDTDYGDSEPGSLSPNYDTECSDVLLNYDSECSDVSLNYDSQCSDVSLNYDTECSGGSSSEVAAFVEATDSDESSSSSSSEISRGPHFVRWRAEKLMEQ